MANFTPAAIVRAFGGCAGHRALAFRSLFAALDAKPREYPPPGIGWLNRRAMVALLRPAPPLAAVVGQGGTSPAPRSPMISRDLP